MSVGTDPAHGGRWTSLTSRGREWLWRREDPARHSVRPGDAFVDVGGVEECLPTIRGVPDHGDVWSRPWAAGTHGEEFVRTGQFRLGRTIRRRGDRAEVAYELAARPGFRFVWAAHALLDVSPSARLEVPAGTPVRVYDRSPEVERGYWPDGLDRLGPDDGTAAGAIVECGTARVVDGTDTLAFEVRAPGQPVSVALWRNLRGWPEENPYRSIGVEPMLGRVFDLASAGPGEAATVGDAGVCRWRVTIS
ncbi:hypothetical protein [Cryptosporangium sp. NPDC051539]|uniref:hypothetical protein n=1 Tax=Cryptosporangium sp. NPDC051539 TaxID=3363962 RepID=UPI0037AEEDD8